MAYQDWVIGTFEDAWHRRVEAVIVLDGQNEPVAVEIQQSRRGQLKPFRVRIGPNDLRDLQKVLERARETLESLQRSTPPRRPKCRRKK